MARKIDFFAIRIAALLLFTAWMIYLTDSFLWGLVIGVSAFLVFSVIYGYYEKKKRPYTYSQLAFYLAMHDSPVDLIAKLLPPDTQFIKENNTLILRSGEMLYISFGFSAFSMNDMIKAIKAAKSHNSLVLTVITSEVDRRIYSIIRRTAIPVNLINIKHVMRIMGKNNILPDIKSKPRKIGGIGDIFTRQAAGRFLLSGSFIAILSILMPMKIYYLVVSLICFIFGLISFTNPGGKTNTNSVLK